MRLPLLGPVLPLAALPHAPALPGALAGLHGPHAGHAGDRTGDPAPGAMGPFGQLLRAGARPGTHPEDHDGHRHSHGRDQGRDNALDPAARQAAQLAPLAPPPPVTAPAPAPAAAPPARASLEDLLPALVRRVAWSGDARRGTVRLELGAGSLSGATLLVQSEQGRVEVRLSVPPGVDAEAWRARIASRLAARGLEVDTIEVT